MMDDWIAITGASSGIGESCAYRFAKRADVGLLLIARRSNELERVAERCAHMQAKAIRTLACDVSNEEQVGQIEDTLNTLGPCKALINSAGIGRFGPLGNTNAELINDVLNTNVRGVLLVMAAFVRARKRALHPATIVNVSSDADSQGFPDASVYCASKGAVKALSAALNREVRQARIRVCNLSPGRVDTHFNNKAPGMRPGALTPDEVAEVIQFIIECSDNIEITSICMDSMSRA